MNSIRRITQQQRHMEQQIGEPRSEPIPNLAKKRLVSSESILSLGRGERSEQVAADDKTTARMFRWASRVAGTPGATQGSRKTSRKRWYGLKDLAPERRMNAEWQMIAGAPENASEALGRQINAGAPG